MYGCVHYGVCTVALAVLSQHSMHYYSSQSVNKHTQEAAALPGMMVYGTIETLSKTETLISVLAAIAIYGS